MGVKRTMGCRKVKNQFCEHGCSIKKFYQLNQKNGECITILECNFELNNQEQMSFFVSDLEIRFQTIARLLLEFLETQITK